MKILIMCMMEVMKEVVFIKKADRTESIRLYEIIKDDINRSLWRGIPHCPWFL